MDQFHIIVPVYLFAEIVDVHIDKVGARIEMGIPHLVGYFNTGK